MAEELISSMFDEPAINAQIKSITSGLEGIVFSIDKIQKAGGGRVSSVSEYDKQLKEQGKTIEDLNAKMAAQKKSLDDLTAAMAKASLEKKKGNTILEESEKLSAIAELNNRKLAATTTDAAKAAAESKLQLSLANKELQQQAKEALGLVSSYDKLKQEFADASKGAQELGARLGASSNEYKKAAAEANALNDKLKAIDAGLGNYQRNVGNYSGAFKGAFNVLSQQLEQVTDKIQSLGDSSPELGGLKEQQELLLKVTTGLNKEFGSTKGELRALQEAAKQLSLAWGQNSEAVQEFIQEVGSAKDDLDDVQQSIKLAGSDTRGFDKIINAAQGISGGFAVAEGAAALFGDENQDLQKTLVKLNAIMTILNGLQAVQNELKNKDSILRKLFIKDTVVQTAATTAQATSTAGATVAQRIYNAVMSVNPIALVIIGLTALVGLFSIFKDKIFALLPGLKAAFNFFEKIATSVTDFVGITSEANRAISKQIESIEKMNAMQKRILSSRDFDEFTKRKIEANNSFRENQKSLLEDVKKGAITQALANDLILSSRLKANKEIEMADKDRIEASEKLIKEEEQKSRKLHSDAAKIELEIRLNSIKQESAVLKAQAEDASNTILERLMASKLYSDKQNEFLEVEKRGMIEISLLDGEISEKRKKIKADFFNKTAQQEIESNSLVKKITEDGAKELNALLSKYNEEARVERERNQKEKVDAEQNAPNLIEARITRQSIINQSSLNDELAALSLKYFESLSGEYDNDKKGYEKYLIEKDNLTKEYAKKTIDVQLEVLNSIAPSSRTEEQKNKIKELYAKITEIVISSNKEQLDNTKKKEQEEGAIVKQKQDALVESVKNITATIKEIASIGFESRKAEIETQKSEIESMYAAEVEAINNSTLSAEEKANRLKIIESNKQVQLEANDKKRRQLESDKAKFDRIANIAAIITNTAVGVAGALAQTAVLGPFAVVLAATIGALGAAQLAVAISAPIPKYAQGTDSHKGGLAIVGDGGKKEVVVTPSGNSYITPSSSTLVDMPKGSKVYPSEKIFNDIFLSSFAPISNNPQDKKTADNANYIALQGQQLAILKKIAKKNNTVTNNINVDLGRQAYLYQQVYS